MADVLTAPLPSLADPYAMQVPYDDLRSWLAEAEKLNEVKYVTGATWDRGIGMAAEVVLHAPSAPCIVFDEIPGFPKDIAFLSISSRGAA